MSDFNAEQYFDWVVSRCTSNYDGCMCLLPPGHDGLHECPVSTCDTTWTTEQADAWLADLLTSHPKRNT